MRSREYWAERMSRLNEHLLQRAEDMLPEIESAYQRAIDRMQRDIETLYQRYATQEGVSLSQAKQKLSAAERKSFALSVEEYIKAAQEHGADPQWVKTLEAVSVRHRITRLEALKLQMQQQVEILSAQKVNALTKTLAEVFEEGYYRTGYEIQRGLGVGTAFATLDVKRIQTALARPWSPDGMNFSQRVWGRDRSKLIHALQSTFTDGLIRGDTQQRMIDDMKKALGTSRRVAGRLVMTESAAIASAAKQDAYQRLGTKQFQFRSTLDGTTCGRCGLMDGQVFDLSEYEIGVTAPPLHPFCRCTTVPYFKDEFTVGERRAARDEDGKVYDVPADMTFEEWKRKCVGGDSADTKKFLRNAVAAINGGTKHSMEHFRESLAHLGDTDVRELFVFLADNTEVYISLRKNSYHKEGAVYLTRGAPHSTIAHELFHKLDRDFEISERHLLNQHIANDYRRLQNIAEGYGGRIEDVLYSKYPNAFVSNKGHLLLKEDYRGIADILNGMSRGEIQLGYRHKNEYWDRPLSLEKETWAQFGRILYQEDAAVTDMLQFICDETYPAMFAVLKEVMKDVYRRNDI